MKCTYFSRCKGKYVNQPKIVSLNEVFTAINDGKYEHHALALQKLTSEDQQRQYKANNIPAVCFNGEFSRRANNALISHNGLATFDADHLDKEGEAEQYKGKISKDPHVLMAGISPRMHGVKFLAKMPIVKNDTEYKQHYTSMMAYFENKYGHKLDESCKDISRLTFLMPDRDIYINPNAEVLNLKDEVSQDVTNVEKVPQSLDVTNVEQTDNIRLPSEKVSFTDLKRKPQELPYWFNEFMLDYIMNNKIPSPRHTHVEKNLVAAYGKNKNWQQIKQRYIDIQREGNDTLKTWEEAWKKGKYPEPSPIEIKHYIKDKNIPFSIRKNTAYENPDEDKLNIATAKDLLSKPLEKVNFIIEKTIPENSIVFMSGVPGGKKSLYALYWGLCIASGKPLLDTYDCKKSGVLYINEENDSKDFLIRIKRICFAHEIKESKLNNFHLANFNNFKLNDKPQYAAVKNEHFVLAMTKHIAEANIKIVILDSFVRMINGEENSSSDIRACFDTMKEVIKVCPGTSFIILHHLGKDVRKGMRGSSDLKGMATLTLNFANQHNGSTTVQPDKVRFMPEREYANLNFMLEDIGNQTDKYYQGLDISEGLHFSQTTKQQEIDANIALAREMRDHCYKKDWKHFKNKQLLKIFVEQKGYPKSTFIKAIKNGTEAEYWKYTNGKDGKSGYTVITAVDDEVEMEEVE